MGSLASASHNAPSGNGNLASVTARTSQAAVGGALSASGRYVGGRLSTVKAMGFSVGGLASIAINQQPAPASLLSLGITAGGMGAADGGSV